MRNVLERASARETAARVACGALAKAFLRAMGVEVRSHVVQVGSVRAPEREPLAAEDFAAVDESPVRCLDAAASDAMVAEIDAAPEATRSPSDLTSGTLEPGSGAIGRVAAASTVHIP